MRFNLDLLTNIEFKPAADSKTVEMMKKIYSDATDEQLCKGQENLENYLKLAWRIAARALREEARAFDNAIENSYDNAKVESNPNINH